METFYIALDDRFQINNRYGEDKIAIKKGDTYSYKQYNQPGDDFKAFLVSYELEYVLNKHAVYVAKVEVSDRTLEKYPLLFAETFIVKEIVDFNDVCEELQKREFKKSEEALASPTNEDEILAFECSERVTSLRFSPTLKNVDTKRGGVIVGGMESVTTARGEYGLAASFNSGPVIAAGDFSQAASTIWGFAKSTGYASIAASTKQEGAVVSSYGYQNISASTGKRAMITSSSNESISAATSESCIVKVDGGWSIAASTGDNNIVSASGRISIAAVSSRCSRAVCAGDRSIAVAAGYSGAEVSGYGSIAVSSRAAKAGINGAIVLSGVNADGEWIVKAGMIGEDGLKPDTWYVLRRGEFVEAPDTMDFTDDDYAELMGFD